MENRNYLFSHNRRGFLKGISLAMGGTALGLPLLSLNSCQSGNTGQREQSDPAVDTSQQSRKLGIALVGLGGYSSGQLAPALQETKNCYLSGIVTGTPSKARDWKSKYNIQDDNVYNYDNFGDISGNAAIDIIYVVLPNGMHADYVVRAAEAGKHVICEKPMATSVADCKRMIDACNRNNVKLSIGYRLHFEPYNMRVMELGQQQVYGKVTAIEAKDSFTLNDASAWRVDKQLAGGGPLMDVGIYCVQGANYTMGKQPIAVTATFGEVTRPAVFKEVEESINWQMEYDDGVIAECHTSYSTNEGHLFGEAENGWWRLEPAYSYSGIDGSTSEGAMEYEQVNQQALQMDDFASCILENRETIVPGEMGMHDVRTLMAIYEAARTGKRVSI